MQSVTAAPRLLLVNRSCAPDCEVCDPCKPPPILSMQRLLGALSKMDSEPPFLFIGTEAFARLEILPELLQGCRDRRLMPILITRGRIIEEDTGSPFDLHALFGFLRGIGPYKLILALDDPHYEQMGCEGVASFLKATRESAGLAPDVLYLLSPGQRVPASLLAHDEVNKLATIRPRAAENLLTFLTNLCRQTATVDLTRTNGGPTDHHFNGHEQLAQPDQFISPSIHEYFADGTPRPANQSAHYPYVLSFNALLFETTYFCNAACNHCYTSSGPDAPRDRLTVADACRVIDEATHLPNLKKQCSLAGGEATIFWNDVILILRHAQSRGFNNSITTNGWWAPTPERATARLMELKDVGVTEIELSVDAMHQAFIRSTAVANIIRAAKETDVSILLRVCTTQKHRAEKVLKLLPTDAQRDISIAVSAVIPIGRAKSAIPLEDIWLEDRGFPIGACHQALNLTVTPNGDVFPCCAGSELCPSLAIGNIFRQSLQEMMLQLRDNTLIRTLVHAGPAHFADMLNAAGLGHKLRGKYLNYCDLCNEIFTNPELSTFLEQAVAGMAESKDERC
jgi:MoaA/NifB/PqqE/SkfB family radical SAM enzyme